MAQESTPRHRIAAAVHRVGEPAFVRQCLDLLSGAEIDATLVEVLGGNSAPHVLSGREGGPEGYWPRTWALRAFLYVWDPVAEPAVIAACGDEHWRVREMAAKVLATRPVASAGAEQALETLVCDGNQRVAAAASRALRS